MNHHQRQPTILSDEPKLSSAALCISLKHLDRTFRPEFTHQCVQEEVFRGYQPLTSVLLEARQTMSLPSCNDTRAVLHKSHLHHDHQATSELEIAIDLAPSCRTCRVHVNSTPKQTTTTKRRAKDEMTGGGGAEKRQKADDSGKISSSHYSSTTITAKEIDEAEVKPMTWTEIQNSIAKALPDIVLENSDEESSCLSDYLSSPIGTVMREYTIDDDDKTFCLSLADGSDPATQDYHQKVQKMAVWFIENADDVDVSNDQSGYWKVLYLFLHSVSQGYALVGYCTLFHFNSPFHKPFPGTICRICQALVLPPFQGQGHGKQMMKLIYDAAHKRVEGGAYVKDNDDQEIVEINVEDPAPGFVALRNKVDWKRLTDHPEYWPDKLKVKDIDDEAFFASIPEAQAVQIGARAKITPHQVHIVNEIQKLEALKAATDVNSTTTTTTTTTTTSKEELERRYRLLVKRRLNRDNREDLSTFATKDAKKAYLAKLYEEQMEQYNKLLKRNKR